MEKHYINVGILGAVSTGKSTLMNTLFVSQYSDMKIKRTTMTPQIYEESPMDEDSLSEDQQEYIKKMNHEINSKLVSKTENDADNVTYEDISNEIVYKVPKVYNLHTLPDNVFLRIYDIPGLNDSKTNDLYFRYLDESFHKFDLIIFVVDINSACNTDGEVKILQKIVEYSKRNREQFGIHNKLLVIANKCDDLHIDQNGHITIENDEAIEMYNQINKEVETQIAKGNPQLEFAICPLSAEDSYIYRMYSKNPSCKLDIRHVNKFGNNEYGKSRWNRLSETERHTKIRQLMSELDIAQTLKQTGFDKFADVLNNKLDTASQYGYICSHIMFDMKALIAQCHTDAAKSPPTIVTLASVQELYKRITFVSFMYDNTEGMALFYAMMAEIMTIHRGQLIIRDSDTEGLINETDLEHYEWAQKHCQKWQDEFGEEFKDMKDLGTQITAILNKYYEANINEQQKPVDTLIKRLNKLIINGFEVTRKTLAALFTNNDMLNKKAEDIVAIIKDMRDRKIININQEHKICKDLLHRIYDNIYNGKAMEYMDADHIGTYVYLADLFWHNSRLFKDENTAEHTVGTVSYLAFRARQNMVAKINSGSRGYYSVGLDLEKHFVSLLME